MGSDADVAYPMLRLDDLRMIYSRKYFVRDDGKVDLSILLDDRMVDAGGAVWRVADVRRIALPKTWIFGSKRYSREYDLATEPAMPLTEVKAIVARYIEADPWAWTHDGPPLEDFLLRIERSATFEELFDVADENCRM
jgi:hypothetical protein